MVKRQGGAGKGPMTDVAFRGKQAELGARKQKQREYEAQTQQTMQGVQGGLDRMQAQENVEAERQLKREGMEQQESQFQQGQALQAAKADLEYDPQTRTYKPTLQAKEKLGIEKMKADTERVEVLSKIQLAERDQHIKLEQHKLALQREGRLTEQQYLDMEDKTNSQIAKYDKALQDLQAGRSSDGLAALLGGGDVDAATAKAANAGDPQAQERVMNKLKNRVTYLALRSSSITGAWPNLDPNSPAGIAWVEHHRGIDAQVRQMAQAYAQMGQPHPLAGLSSRQQKRFVIEEAARTFLPIYSMKTARMQNGPGTGSPTPGAGGVQSGGKFGSPAPAGPYGATGTDAAAGGLAGGAGAQPEPRSTLGDPQTGLRPGTWDQQR